MNAGLDAARTALADARAWLVGGALRDRELGRETADLDIVLDGDTAAAARAVARAGAPATCFALSEEFGSWRVASRAGDWQLDLEPLRGSGIEQDLALRDFTINAIAEPLAGGELLDPLGGLEDVRARRLRMAGPRAFADDPLRVLRLARIAVELDFEVEAESGRAAALGAAGLRAVAAERVFAELRRIVAADRARRGLELLEQFGASAIVLPEIEPMRGVAQNRFHHLDVHGHTLEVFDRTVELTRPGGPERGGALERAIEPHAAAVTSLLAEPLADEMTRGEALRWGALLHDAAKPLTRDVRAADGRVTFIGHDSRGAELARAALARLRSSERLRAHVAALVRHHLRLGFLVHEPQPLSRRTVFAYLRACTPVEVDVTLLSIADRLATRGDRSEQAIEAHLRVAAGMLDDALRWRAEGPGDPLLRGDELAGELGIATGPRVGRLLDALAEAQYAGELATREQALAYAREAARSI